MVKVSRWLPVFIGVAVVVALGACAGGRVARVQRACKEKLC